MGKMNLACAAAVLTILFGSVAAADTTPVSPATAVGEDSLEGYGGILDQLYGWDNVLRIDDASDGSWSLSEPNGSAQARARFAGYEQHLGYFDDEGPHLVFSNTGSNPNAIYLGAFDDTLHTFIPVGTNFEFGLEAGGNVWSSNQDDNPGGRDHMVTYLILDSDDPNSIGNYIIAWEDLDLGDVDYNDFIIEVSGVKPMPEPATLALLGAGAAGLAVAARRRRRTASRS